MAAAIRQWLDERSVGTLFIAPGSPWENAYVESFNGKLRDELLDREVLTSLVEARYLLEEYRVTHNERRPHSALGYMTPQTFTRAWVDSHRNTSAATARQGQARSARRSATLDAPRPPRADATMSGRQGLPDANHAGLS